jgi:general secretion pathway protein G
MNDLYNRALRRRRAGEGGFTLIELLVVIAILSVLAAIVIFNVTGVKSTSESAACNTDVQSVQSAVDQYLNNLLPGATDDFASAGTTAASITSIDGNVTADLVTNGAYLNAPPTACSSAGTPWGNIMVSSTDQPNIVVSGTYS